MRERRAELILRFGTWANGRMEEQVWVEKIMRDFPGGPVVKNPPRIAGEAGLTPGRGTKIPHAAEQLGPLATPREPRCHNY